QSHPPASWCSPCCRHHGLAKVSSGADPAGPSHWKELKATCGGSQQSPIDIERRRLRRDGRLGDILFEGYDQAPPGKWRLTNDGHTGASRARLCAIRGGGLPGTYRALQLHFHWGSPAGNGSEHTLDGRQFPMEVGGSLERVPPGKPRLGMPVVMVGLTVLIPAVSVGDSVDLASTFPLSNLLPHAGQLSKYYRYQGSLTTPDCSEVVVWTVFEEPVAVSRAQVTVRDPAGSAPLKMTNNFRPPQPLHGRRVRASRLASASGAARGARPLPWALLLLLPLPLLGARPS
uniref:Alpha-carbonic anhydrase domain-containing protein n=1 Tax=Nothoprocta perdicaria TaxID=30464 RepID=A0A8C7EDY9_NOTPE